MSGEPTPALVGASLSRRFGTRTALRSTDLRLARGDRIALLGPNGAGKTTLLRILALALSPTTGTLRVAGIDVKREAPRARRLVGFISHKTGLYDDLTARENLQFYGRLYGVEALEQSIDRTLSEVALPPTSARVPVRTLSRGMQQRAGLARAILHEPAVLLMDEPETGLDPQAQEWLVGLVNRWAAADRTVVVATHRLDWAQRFADRALVLENGSLKADLPVGASPHPLLAEAYRSAVEAAW
ncbi:MAG: ABC transporter ATP-binding protein [Chloroflexi bacterium]|nr:ABC transporter ATP-binding protein [Chloroflexota bacterium]